MLTISGVFEENDAVQAINNINSVSTNKINFIDPNFSTVWLKFINLNHYVISYLDTQGFPVKTKQIISRRFTNKQLC